MKENKKQEIDVCILLPGDTFHQYFVNALTNTILTLVNKGKSFFIKDAYSSILPDLRNKLVGGRSGIEGISNEPFHFDGFKPKKVFFIDSDIVWNAEEFDRLLNSDEDIISGWYSRVDGMTVVLQKDDKGYLTVPATEMIQKTELMEVDGIGLGFMCVKYEVLEKMGYPWFQFTIPDNPSMGDENDSTIMIPTSGEDVWFCQRAKEEGYKIIVDPTIQLRHLKTVPVYLDKETYNNANKL
jgi:hypothetical protein